MSDFVLPSKIMVHLRRLKNEYEQNDKGFLAEIIKSCRVFIREEAHYDNWNGGTYGHDVVLFLPESLLAQINVDHQKHYTSKLNDDLKICAESVSNEYYTGVSLEMADEEDAENQKSRPFSKKATANPDALSFWKPRHIRLFISHRDKYKKAARELADDLEEYGISSFVAHESIEPMESWQNEILKGLETMEVMLVFLTDDFHDSTWTNQEIGYALGHGIDIIALKFGKSDPAGFISSQQALKGQLDAPTSSTEEICKIMADKLGYLDRLSTTIVTAFVNSKNFSDAQTQFIRLEALVPKLSNSTTEIIIQGFRDNTQLHNAFYLTKPPHRLINYLKRATGKRYTTKGPVLSRVDTEEDDMPFVV